MNIQSLIDTNYNLEISTILIYLTTCLILCLIVYLLYRLTFNGIAYSNNFNISIVLTGLITTVIMMVIGNNLALSLGMVGALSIVRFRAAIKEPKDISYLFWAIAIGLATGSGAIQIAIVATLFISAVILAFHYVPDNNNAYLLIIKGSEIDNEALESTMNNQCKKYKLKVRNTKQDFTEIIYEVRIRDNERKINELLSEITGIENINIIKYDSHLND